jgi:hypothetical protein
MEARTVPHSAPLPNPQSTARQSFVSVVSQRRQSARIEPCAESETVDTGDVEEVMINDSLLEQNEETGSSVGASLPK